MSVPSFVSLVYLFLLIFVLVQIVQIPPRGETLRGGVKMNCILNHCNEQIATDVAVIIYYATAVSAMIVFAWFSQSKTIQTAALMIAGVWLVSIIYFLFVGGLPYYALTLLVDCLLGYQFWRMARAEIFPAALCVLVICEAVFLIGAAAMALDAYWIIFVLNRIFELILAYMIGCSIYRIRKLNAPDEQSSRGADLGPKFIAA